MLIKDFLRSGDYPRQKINSHLNFIEIYLFIYLIDNELVFLFVIYIQRKQLDRGQKNKTKNNCKVASHWIKCGKLGGGERQGEVIQAMFFRN